MKEKKGLIIGIVIGAIVLIAAIVVGVLFATGKIGKKSLRDRIGEYELIEMSDGEETYSEDSLNTLKDFGFDVKLELKKDRKGTIKMSGEDEKDIKYDEEYLYIPNEDDEEEKQEYKYEDGKLTLEDAGVTMVFEKKD